MPPFPETTFCNPDIEGAGDENNMVLDGDSDVNIAL